MRWVAGPRRLACVQAFMDAKKQLPWIAKEIKLALRCLRVGLNEIHRSFKFRCGGVGGLESKKAVHAGLEVWVEVTCDCPQFEHRRFSEPTRQDLSPCRDCWLPQPCPREINRSQVSRIPIGPKPVCPFLFQSAFKRTSLGSPRPA